MLGDLAQVLGRQVGFLRKRAESFEIFGLGPLSMCAVNFCPVSARLGPNYTNAPFLGGAWVRSRPNWGDFDQGRSPGSRQVQPGPGSFQGGATDAESLTLRSTRPQGHYDMIQGLVPPGPLPRQKGSFYRSEGTIKRLDMYTKRPNIKKMKEQPSGPVRIQPDRRWFGNTRVIAQDLAAPDFGEFGRTAFSAYFPRSDRMLDQLPNI